MKEKGEAKKDEPKATTNVHTIIYVPRQVLKLMSFINAPLSYILIIPSTINT